MNVRFFGGTKAEYLSLKAPRNPLGLYFCEDTQELLNDMCDWLFMMKTKIEDHITSRYYREGRLNHLEVLKRRYKDEWSERTEQNIEATVQDTELKVVIEDA